MIGLLFSNGKLHKYSIKIQQMLNNTIINTESIFAFTIDNIDFSKKTCYGNTISKESILPVTLKLPSVIFNLSVQYTNVNVKKLRQLAELDDVFFINEANKYSQLTVMEILSSSNTENKYLVPFAKSSKDTVREQTLHPSNLLMMSTKGASRSKMVYLEMNKEYLNLSIPKTYSLALSTPQLLTYNSSILIVRSYAQRGEKGNWKFLTSTVNLKEITPPEASLIKLKNATLDINNYIGKFIPSLGVCFIDFILDNENNPYFLHLGGWDYRLLKVLKNKGLQEVFLKNLCDYTKYCNSKVGGDAYVD